MQSGDLTYTDDERDPIEYEAVMSYIIENESDIDDIPQVFEMRITDSDVTSYIGIGFSYATIYCKTGRKRYTIYLNCGTCFKMSRTPLFISLIPAIMEIRRNAEFFIILR